MATRLSLILGVVLLTFGVACGADFYADCFQEPSSTVFVSGFQRFVSLKNNDGIPNKYNPTAGAVGYVYRANPWFVGASLSYEQGIRRYNVPGLLSGRIDSDLPGVTLFGGWSNPDGWYAKGSTFIGYNTLKAKNLATPVGWVSGDKDHSTQFGASLELGKAFTMAYDLTLKPHVGFDYSRAQGESYTMSAGGVPAFPLSIGSQNFYEIPIGVSFSRTFHTGNWAITPEVDVTMVNSLGHIDNMNYYPGFASRTADEWKVYGIGGDNLGARIRAGVNAKVNSRTSMGLDYTYEGRSGYNDHRISALVGWSF